MTRSFHVSTGILAGVCLLVASGSAMADEYRAFWVDAWGAGLRSQSEVNNLLGVVGDPNSKGQIREANCNTVFVQVRRRADVCYPSAMGEPYFSGLSPSNFNALQAMINAAHDTTGGKQRIEVHAWIVTFATGTETTSGPVFAAHNNPGDPENHWVTLDNTGAITADKAFDPGHPRCLEYTVNVAMDLVNNYDIDGLHYDYIRFTANNQGYNPRSIARYNERYGLTGQPSASNEQFKQWRRDQVTALVRQVYARIQASKPHVKQSGSFVTWNPSPTSSTRAGFQGTRPYYDVYSDWDSWIQEGIVDIAVPMTYYDYGGNYRNDWTRWINFEKDRKGNRHMIIGPGIYLNSLSNAITEILQTRTPSPAGNTAHGFSGYSYRVPYSGGTWANFKPQLIAQVTPTPDVIPTMPWKTNPTTGHISGTVTHGGVWADHAQVTLTGPVNRTQYVDGTGFYAFIDLPPGAYTVTASKAGYANAQASATVAVGQVTGNMYLRDIVLGAGSSAPVITAVQAVPGTTTATITWTTNLPATSQVNYGLTPAYGSQTPLDSATVTSHSVSLAGLQPNTVYNYQVFSTNAGGSAQSGNATFTTLSAIPDVIVDNVDTGYAQTGSWIVGSAAATSKYGADYVYANETSGTSEASATATARWTPVLPAPGYWDVYIWYSRGTNRSTNSFWKVVNAGSPLTFRVNQEQNGNGWTLLASDVPFNAGSAGYVHLGNNTGITASSNIVQGDAVRFVYKSALPDTQAPSIPTGLTATAVSVDAVQLNWDPSTDDVGVSGYKVYRNGALLASSATNDHLNEFLTPNTSYSYTVSAFDEAQNESAQSSPAIVRASLSVPPSESTVTCNRPSGAWYTTSGFTFTAVGGFGPGTVSKYRYAWNNSPTHTWSGSEPQWNAGTLALTAASGGAWYLHLKGYNSQDVENGTLDLGLYGYDTTPPGAPVVTDDGAYTSSLDALHAAWTATDSESGIKSYDYRIREAGDAVIVDWTSVGSATSVHATGLDLAPRKTYYVDVRATNNVDLVGPVGTSNGIVVFPYDPDANDHVDVEDFAAFLACASGASIPYAPAHPASCAIFDADADSDVDQDDFGAFQRCYTGTKPINVACMD